MHRIIAVSMVKNEADIIESFLRHTLSFADSVLVADHMSTDRTGEILGQLRREGLPLEIFHLHKVELAHSEVMTGLMRKAIEEYGADLVLPLDADEFLVNTDNRAPVRDILRQLPSDNVYHLNWRLYEPMHPREGEERFLLSRPCWRQKEFSGGQKIIVGARAARQKPFYLIQGCHYAVYEDGSGPVPMVVAPCLHTAHFHWRSDEQFESKSIVSWINNVAKYTSFTGTAGGLHDFFQKALAGERIEPDTLLKEEEREPFDLSPFVAPQELRYSGDARPDPKRNFLIASERIAEALAEEKYLKKGNLVTAVLPYLGDAEAWERSFASLLEQTYPFLEILVPELSSELPDSLRQRVGEGIAKEKVFILQSKEGEDVFSILGQRARGIHVQWVLPGASIAPRKIQLMSACLDAQDGNYQLLLCTGDEEFPLWSPYVDFVFSTGFMKSDPQQVWTWMLRRGKYLPGGIASALARREVMDDCGWFRGCFLDGLPLEFSMFRQLLLHGRAAGDFRPIIGTIGEQLCSVRRDPPLARCLLHQMEWMGLLELDRERLTRDEFQETLRFAKSLRDELRRIPWQGEDDARLWKEYEAGLCSLEGEV